MKGERFGAAIRLAVVEARRAVECKKSVAVVFAFVLFYAFFPTVIVREIVRELPAGAGVSVRSVTSAFVNLYCFVYALSMALFIVQTLSMDVFVSDKRSGAMAVQMACPVSVRVLWASKSLAVAVVGYASTLLATVLFNVALPRVVPGHAGAPDLWALLYVTVVLPVLVAEIASTAGAAQMLSKSYSSMNFMLFALAFVILGVPSFLASKMTQVRPEHMFAIYTGIAVSLLVWLLWVSQRLIDKQRIVLTS